MDFQNLDSENGEKSVLDSEKNLDSETALDSEISESKGRKEHFRF